MARPICGYAKKQKFPNKLECDLAIAKIRSNISRHRGAPQRDEPKRSYQCEACHKWHMTSQDKDSPDRELLTG